MGTCLELRCGIVYQSVIDEYNASIQCKLHNLFLKYLPRMAVPGESMCASRATGARPQ